MKWYGWFLPGHRLWVRSALRVAFWQAIEYQLRALQGVIENAKKRSLAQQPVLASDKKIAFLINHEGNIADGKTISGDVEATLNYIRSYLTEMKEGEGETFEITRRDMTQAELDAAPVI